MTELLSLRAAVDIALVFMLLEVFALVIYRKRTGRGLPLRDVVPMLVAGGALLLALRIALHAPESVWILVCLSGALIGHLADLLCRLDSRANRFDGLRDNS